MNFKAFYLTLLSSTAISFYSCYADESSQQNSSLLDFFGPQSTTSSVSNPSIPSTVVPSSTPFSTTSITTGAQPQSQPSVSPQKPGTPEVTPLASTTPPSVSPTVSISGTSNSGQQTPTSGVLPMSLAALTSTPTQTQIAAQPTPINALPQQVTTPAAAPTPQSSNISTTTPVLPTTPLPVISAASTTAQTPPSTLPSTPASQNSTTQTTTITPTPAPIAQSSVIQAPPIPQTEIRTQSTPQVMQTNAKYMAAFNDRSTPPLSQQPISANPHEIIELVPEDDFIPTTPNEDHNALASAAYLGSYLEPWRNIPDEKIEFFFENAELSALLSFIEQKFNITFLLDDSIKPLPKGGKSIIGSKISFKTHTPLTKKAAWDIFVSFLDMAGMSPIPGPQPGVYRLIGSKEKDSGKSPLPTLIGVDSSLIPDNDTLIRYVYFVENNTIDIIENTIKVMKSASSPEIIRFAALNALIITDRASNIKAMLAVIEELDNSERQEALAIIKLKYADASSAKKLYDSLAQGGGAASAARPSGRKNSTTDYFNKATRVIAEPRTNSLIIIGTRDAIKVITEFIQQNIDSVESLPDVPRYIYALKFLEASHLAKILQDSVAFKTDSEAARYGGVRDGDRYFKPITITAEPTTNSLIINADYEDYSKLYTLLQSIDIEQPQIALRLFLVNINLTDTKAFGTQLRNKIPGANSLLGNQVNFQTSNLAGTGGSGSIQERSSPPPPPITGATQLLGNLVNLANFASLGSTVITLGSDSFGVWGILNMLQTFSQANVVANPFIVTTNKYPAQFVSGDIRRVTDATIFGQQTQNSVRDDTATLDIRITPQISREDKLVTLDIAISFEQFVIADPTSSNGNKTARRLETTVVMGSNEILALGGLMSETVTEAVTKVPILGDIPVLGWLFQNRSKILTTSSILVLVVPEIIHARERIGADILTSNAVHDAKSATREIQSLNNIRDPINRLFFQDNTDPQGEFIDNFMSNRNSYVPQALNDIPLDEKRHREKNVLPACSQRGRRLRKSKARKTATNASQPQQLPQDTDAITPVYGEPAVIKNISSPPPALTVPGE